MATPAQVVRGREALVTIRVDANGDIKVTPDRFIIHKSNHEMVTWACEPAQDFRIEFGDDSPFYESEFDQDHPCSGLARRDVLPSKSRTYKYSVWVGETYLDPDGKIET
jgi:hypothetical protein